MSKHTVTKQSTLSRIMRSDIGSRKSVLSLPPIPLLHTVSGSSGFWDEIVSFAVIAVIVITLVFYAVSGAIHRIKRGKRRLE